MYTYRYSYYFLFIVFSFAVASSYILNGGNITEGLFPSTYYLKHVSIIFLSIVGIFIVFRKLKINRIILFLIIPYLGYTGINYGIVFFQFVSFGLGVYTLSYIYSYKFFLNKKILVLFFLIIILIPAIDIFLNNGSFIYNSFYGRERLLLGYFHPKEAGMFFLTFAISLLLSLKIRYKAIYHICIFVLLWFIQSRNAFLFYANFLLFNLLIKYFKVKFAVLFFIFTYLITPIILISIFWKKINLLISNRLDVWLNGFEVNLFGKICELSTESNVDLFKYKFHIDNFYLEFLIENGPILLTILIFILIYIGYKVRNIYINNYSLLAFYLAFLIYCFFDSGMFSTGSFINIYVWSVILHGIRYEKIYKGNFNANNI